MTKKKVLKVRPREDGSVGFENVTEAVVFMEEFDLLPEKVTLDEVTGEMFETMKEIEQ